MFTPIHLGMAGPLGRAHLWALGRLVSFDLTVVDLRLALIALLTRSLVRASNALVRHVMGRAWKGARSANDITAAATMVAAAWR
ncbi:hypothetical protein [Bradyrhizobium liaoningense]|uniref:hypothetical protein n=1 Tax=Bradyrhizobium liaoningense TaxID=43992 RepID=UPI001BA9AACC|nr:hypothetical protein [Bradyrhizobium liaoningense]MBR0716682.1 hypothetical protein [Bradyrhizobium liaoningense]